VSLTYLLDTDTCSFAITRRPEVFARLQGLRRDSWAISSLVYAELAFGLVKGAMSPRSHTALNKFLQGAQVVAFDAKAARRAAEIRVHQQKQGKSSGAIDQLIAGHALSLNLTLVTGNTKHFDDIPGLVIDSWVQR
jgi:tRNA(fMet)-specific endonuclease VapC